jgi:hypothetical protein
MCYIEIHSENGMLPACILVLAHLCIAEIYRPVSTRGGPFKPQNDVLSDKLDEAATDRLGVKIAVPAGDVVVFWPIKEMNTICENNNCILYRKNCDDKLMRCDYAAGNLQLFNFGSGPRQHFSPEKFIIEYNNKRALAAAENNVFLVTGPKGKEAYIPLSKLRTTPGWDLPACWPDSSEPGC